MRRPIKIVLLALGTILGYGFAFHAMQHHHGWYRDGYGYDGYCDHERWGRWRNEPPPPRPEPPKTETPAPQ
jgi:hypothetical protein